MNSYFSAWRKYAVFEGRTSRSTFWSFFLVDFVIVILMAVLDEMLGTAPEDGLGLLVRLYLLILSIPRIAITVRRLHDADYSGWWGLLPVALVFLFFRGTVGPNRYGSEPSTETSTQAPNVTQSSKPVTTHYVNATQKQHDLIGDIERLARLRTDGKLTESEYESMKAQAIDGYSPSRHVSQEIGSMRVGLSDSTNELSGVALGFIKFAGWWVGFWIVFTIVAVAALWIMLARGEGNPQDAGDCRTLAPHVWKCPAEPSAVKPFKTDTEPPI